MANHSEGPQKIPDFPINTLVMDYIIACDGDHDGSWIDFDDPKFKEVDHLLSRIYRRLGFQQGREEINKARKAYEIMHG